MRPFRVHSHGRRGHCERVLCHAFWWFLKVFLFEMLIRFFNSTPNWKFIVRRWLDSTTAAATPIGGIAFSRIWLVQTKISEVVSAPFNGASLRSDSCDFQQLKMDITWFADIEIDGSAAWACLYERNCPHGREKVIVQSNARCEVNLCCLNI